MARDISQTTRNTAERGHVTSILLVEMNFESGLVALTSAPFTVNYNGVDYLGVGNLGRINPIKEGNSVTAYGVSFELSGIPSDYISLALAENYQGRGCRIYLAFLDADHQIVDAPVLTFSGRMDTMTLEIGDTATIRVNAESKFADWDRPRIRRYTHEDQIEKYPTDKGLEFVSQIADIEIIWGRG